MSQAFLFDAVRSPRGRGRADGALHLVRPVDLLAAVLAALQARTGLDPALVDDVVAGCVTQTGEQGACIARFAALQAGWPETIPGVTHNRFCGSGLEAVNHAAAMVAAGYQRLVVAGGVECMSRVKMGADGGAWWDAATQWSIGAVPQGISADLLATIHGFSREDLDAFALESQRRVAVAQASGAFDRGLTPIRDGAGLTLLDRDEYPRPETTAEALGALKPAFTLIGERFGLDALVRRRYPTVERIRHVHTAGNSSGIVDGAAALLVGSAEAGAGLGLAPRARIRALAAVGSEPLAMLTGPMEASRKALAMAGMAASDIDLYEVNEAFAVVPLLFMRELGVSAEKVNIHGGAIALGHPLGATGAMLLGTLLDNLEERDAATGLVTLCIGGGMGIATIIERV
ncbi:MAG: acetyl-CoA C-acetyltransferase [Pseudomonadota bacterium]